MPGPGEMTVLRAHPGGILEWFGVPKECYMRVPDPSFPGFKQIQRETVGHLGGKNRNWVFWWPVTRGGEGVGCVVGRANVLYVG